MLSGTIFGQYSNIYLIGSATEAIWDITAAVPMIQEGSNAQLFTWEDTLMTGEIKFETNNSA